MKQRRAFSGVVDANTSSRLAQVSAGFLPNTHEANKINTEKSSTPFSAQIWQNAFHLLEVDIELRAPHDSTRYPAVRTQSAKRQASSALLERDSKSPKTGDSSNLLHQSDQSLLLTDNNQTAGKNADQKGVNIYQSVYARGPLERRRRADADDVRSYKVDIEIFLENEDLLGSAELNIGSKQDAVLLDAMLVLGHVSKNCPCKVIASLLLNENNSETASKLRLTLLWKSIQSLSDVRIESGCEGQPVAVLAEYLSPQKSQPAGPSWEPRTFYESVYTPPFHHKSFGGVSIPGLRTSLYSFQSRSLAWLLQREQAPLSQNFDNLRSSRYPAGFSRIADIYGRPCLFSGWLRSCTDLDSRFVRSTDELRGGILAEEMGLGKTIEMIALIQMHKRSDQTSPTEHDQGFHPTPATLIIVPKSILQQWKEELQKHAPSVTVMVYDGIKADSRKTENATEKLTSLFDNHDVVLVTYETLTKEIWYALDPPARSRRYVRVYERTKSPLVRVDWWRIVLDEAQMVESGVTYAAKVAVQLSRRNAWAVSGTPMKKDSHDLFGLLTFLRLEPFCSSSSWWGALLQDYLPIFQDLVQSICLRHSKDQVRAELQLPPQKRVVINVPFTAIEEQNYTQSFEEMAADCGLDLNGFPQPDFVGRESAQLVSLMRSWLARLRQICLHPEVGDKNRRALGRRDGAPLRTVEDVLSVMCEQNETSLRSEERNRLQSMLKRGQIKEYAKNPGAALEIWQYVDAEAEYNVRKDRRALMEAEEEEREDYHDAKINDHISGIDKDDDYATSRSARLKNRLRISLEVKHTAIFFIANALYQIKTDEKIVEPGSERFRDLEQEENQKYEDAKVLRRELLSGAATRASSLINRIVHKTRTEDFVKLLDVARLDLDGGIGTRRFVDLFEDIQETLNQQSLLLREWRENLVKGLSAPLVDQEDAELTGKEYEESTKEEDKLHAYMEAIRLLVADRSHVITGQKNTNVRREASNLLRSAMSGEGHAPALMKRLITECNNIRLGETQEGEIQVCLRGLIAQLNQYRGSIEYRGKGAAARAEMNIGDHMLNMIREHVSHQQKIVVELEKESQIFSDTVNARVEYYKQLQDISDLVAPYEEEMSEQDREFRLACMEESEAQSQKHVDKLRSRAKYLEHLRRDSNAEDIERKCIICQDTFDTGCLTSCGHVYCKECILLWWKQHRTCPTCKAPIRGNDLHPITYKPLALTIQEHVQTSANTNRGIDKDSFPQDRSIYSTISQRNLQEIKAYDLRGSYGTKVDMLARHLLWVRERDPGAKSVVFSQFRDFLGVLEHAFTRFGIGWASIEAGSSGTEKFKKDPGVECLLLHAKAQASGLNLINATHLFICEPLINTAIELQVIARIHRIGQNLPTTVWMYIIEDTVEKAIYEISTKRRLAYINNGSHPLVYADNNSSDVEAPVVQLEDKIDSANSLQMEDAPTARLLAGGRSGGEQVAKDDLWPCLFKYKPAMNQTVMTEEAEAATANFLVGQAASERALS